MFIPSKNEKVYKFGKAKISIIKGDLLNDFIYKEVYLISICYGKLYIASHVDTNRKDLFPTVISKSIEKLRGFEIGE